MHVHMCNHSTQHAFVCAVAIVEHAALADDTPIAIVVNKKDKGVRVQIAVQRFSLRAPAAVRQRRALPPSVGALTLLM